MLILARRSTWPQLQLVPGALARLHGDGLTLLPVSTTRETGLSVEPLSSGGYGILLKTADTVAMVAQYPTQRLACRQLHRLAGSSEGKGWAWVGRGFLIAALLFLIWFLFFLPADLSVLSAKSPNGEGVPAVRDDPAMRKGSAQMKPRPAAPSSTHGPAWIDDPAVITAPLLTPETHLFDTLPTPRPAP